MLMEVVDMDTDHGLNMVIIVLVCLTGEVLNPRLTSNLTMLTDISHMQHGEQVVMDQDLVTEVPEVEKVWS